MGKKNAAGKYRARVKIGVDKNGRAINKYVCAPTLRELEEKKTMLRRHYTRAIPWRRTCRSTSTASSGTR